MMPGLQGLRSFLHIVQIVWIDHVAEFDALDGLREVALLAVEFGLQEVAVLVVLARLELPLRQHRLASLELAAGELPVQSVVESVRVLDRVDQFFVPQVVQGCLQSRIADPRPTCTIGGLRDHESWFPLGEQNTD